MDHSTLISSLPDQTRAQLTARSDAPGLRHLAGHIGALIVTGAWIAFALPLWPLVLIIHGVLLSFLFTLEHECTHQTPFATAWLSEAIGTICGVILFLPFRWFRAFHLAHHRYTNDPERDPELQGGGRPETWSAYLIYLSGWGFWSGNFKTLLANARGQLDAPYIPKTRKSAIVLEARIMLGVYGLALASLLLTPALFWLWLLPLILGQPALRAYLLAEHGHCPAVANMFENTRTTLTSRIVRALAWNMPYHAEHHAYPSVPFHQLPSFHQQAQAHLKSVSDGYIAFSKSYAAGLDGKDTVPPPT